MVRTPDLNKQLLSADYMRCGSATAVLTCCKLHAQPAQLLSMHAGRIRPGSGLARRGVESRISPRPLSPRCRQRETA